MEISKVRRSVLVNEVCLYVYCPWRPLYDNFTALTLPYYQYSG